MNRSKHYYEHMSHANCINTAAGILAVQAMNAVFRCNPQVLQCKLDCALVDLSQLILFGGLDMRNYNLPLKKKIVTVLFISWKASVGVSRSQKCSGLEIHFQQLT